MLVKILKKIGKIMLYILAILVVLIIAIFLFLKFASVFGGKIEGERLDTIMSLEYFKDGKFQNLSGKKLGPEMRQEASNNGGIKDFLFPKEGKLPSKALPSQKFEKADFLDGDFVWFGHSTVLFQTAEKNILTDPVFNRASPIPIFGKEFAVEHKTQIEDLPDIDVIVISHDHYDHLDYKAIVQLAKKTKKIFVPIGIGAHLERWGIDSEKVVELSWYESASYEGIDLTLTPTQHFSGRSLSRNTTLWGAWVIKSPDKNIYFSGDTGYSDEFKKVGEKYGPFDIAFLENGAYNTAWSDMHMFPKQTVQASIDLDANIIFPIHWSKFDLAFHDWDEPITRLILEANTRGKTYTTPRIGEIFTIDDREKLPQTHWWENL